MSLIYLDNAATSWPKPPGMSEAIADFINHVGGNPGRSGHRMSIAAGRRVYRTRQAVARLFGADPLRVVFTCNGTEALNVALHGWVRPGDHVITTSIEHNSVMRPLRALEREGARVTVVPCSSSFALAPAAIEKAIAPETTLVVMTHASNVTGAILPIEEVARIARRRSIPLLVDVAQTAGVRAIDIERMGIDMLAFTGHKTLYGPTGTGGLVLRRDFDARGLRPLKQGGTGSRSQSEQQPDFLPDAFESGTLNAAGLAGLACAVEWVLAQSVQRLEERSREQRRRIESGLRGIPRVRLYGPEREEDATSVVAFNIDSVSPSDVGRRLDSEYGVLCRVGLHCAPAAHRTNGTYPRGCVRFSPSALTGDDEIDRAVEAVFALSQGGD